MKKIRKQKDSYGQDVIYVSECDKYLYEKQEVDINKENERFYDIMYQIENYYGNSMRYDDRLRDFINGGNE